MNTNPVDVLAVARGVVALRELAAKARKDGNAPAAATYAAQARSAERSIRRAGRAALARVGAA